MSKLLIAALVGLLNLTVGPAWADGKCSKEQVKEGKCLTVELRPAPTPPPKPTPPPPIPNPTQVAPNPTPNPTCVMVEVSNQLIVDPGQVFRFPSFYVGGCCTCSVLSLGNLSSPTVHLSGDVYLGKRWVQVCPQPNQSN